MNENKIINTKKNFKATINGPIDVNNVVVMRTNEIAKKKNMTYWEQIKEQIGMGASPPLVPLQPHCVKVDATNEIPKPKRKFIIDRIKEMTRPSCDKSSSAIKLKKMCNFTTDEYINLDEYVEDRGKASTFTQCGQGAKHLEPSCIADPTLPCVTSDNSVGGKVTNEEQNISIKIVNKPVIENESISILTEINNHEETQYINLIREIITTGYDEFGRNGDTLTKFGYSMRFSLRDGTMPILTTKKLAWRVCFEELFWFIRGETNNKKLQEKNVRIWDQNSSREFLDSRGLYHLEEGDLGPIYGFQWRHFNTDYTDSTKCYQGEGVDQLEQIIETLKNPVTRTSRRMIMTAWNPCQLNYMALPPCHILAQFHVRENKYLSCALYQRSGDVGLGVPFNIASYSLLTHILAKHCGLEADEFIHFLGNCHIYKEHIMPLKQQIKLEPKSFPKIEIRTTHDSIDDYCLDDISWIKPYESHPVIKMVMKA